MCLISALSFVVALAQHVHARRLTQKSRQSGHSSGRHNSPLFRLVNFFVMISSLCILSLSTIGIHNRDAVVPTVLSDPTAAFFAYWLNALSSSCTVCILYAVVYFMLHAAGKVALSNQAVSSSSSSSAAEASSDSSSLVPDWIRIALGACGVGSFVLATIASVMRLATNIHVWTVIFVIYLIVTIAGFTGVLLYQGVKIINIIAAVPLLATETSAASVTDGDSAASSSSLPPRELACGCIPNDTASTFRFKIYSMAAIAFFTVSFQILSVTGALRDHRDSNLAEVPSPTQTIKCGFHCLLITTCLSQSHSLYFLYAACLFVFSLCNSNSFLMFFLVFSSQGSSYDCIASMLSIRKLVCVDSLLESAR